MHIKRVKFRYIGEEPPRITVEEYKQALSRLFVLMEAQPDTSEGDELDRLATAIDDYESRRFDI